MDAQEITTRSEEPPQWGDLHETNDDEPPQHGAPRDARPCGRKFPPRNGRIGAGS